jgi:hypothetical protein
MAIPGATLARCASVPIDAVLEDRYAGHECEQTTQGAEVAAPETLAHTVEDEDATE